MNERIKQLIKQCYETGPIGRDGWPEYSRLSEEKFAQLIVMECTKILADNSEFRGCVIIGKHFGVEA